MKKLALIIGGTSLLSAGVSLAAITCTPAPSCASLGYTSSAGSCSNYVVCPFDTSKIACLEKDCTDYTLSSCPTGGTCAICQNSSGNNYKLEKCNAGYKLTVTGSCTSKSCSDYGYSTLSLGVVCKNSYSVQLGAVDTNCYSGCKPCSSVVTCNTYDSVCPAAATTQICYVTSSRTVSGYPYGSCLCYNTAKCGVTNSVYCRRLVPDREEFLPIY